MMRPAYRDRCFASKASGGVPERPKGADCKSAVTDFEGSNPSPTTIFSLLMRAQRKLKLHKTRRGRMRSFDKVRAERSETTRFSTGILQTKRHRNLADLLLNISKTMNTMVGFPSGQREQTVNLPSQTSKVRILPPPPSLYVPQY